MSGSASSGHVSLLLRKHAGDPQQSSSGFLLEKEELTEVHSPTAEGLNEAYNDEQLQQEGYSQQQGVYSQQQGVYSQQQQQQSVERQQCSVVPDQEENEFSQCLEGDTTCVRSATVSELNSSSSPCGLQRLPESLPFDTGSSSSNHFCSSDNIFSALQNSSSDSSSASRSSIHCSSTHSSDLEIHSMHARELFRSETAGVWKGAPTTDGASSGVERGANFSVSTCTVVKSKHEEQLTWGAAPGTDETYRAFQRRNAQDFFAVSPLRQPESDEEVLQQLQSQQQQQQQQRRTMASIALPFGVVDSAREEADLNNTSLNAATASEHVAAVAARNFCFGTRVAALSPVPANSPDRRSSSSTTPGHPGAAAAAAPGTSCGVVAAACDIRGKKGTTEGLINVLAFTHRRLEQAVESQHKQEESELGQLQQQPKEEEDKCQHQQQQQGKAEEEMEQQLLQETGPSLLQQGEQSADQEPRCQQQKRLSFGVIEAFSQSPSSQQSMLLCKTGGSGGQQPSNGMPDESVLSLSKRAAIAAMETEECTRERYINSNRSAFSAGGETPPQQQQCGVSQFAAAAAVATRIVHDDRRVAALLTLPASAAALFRDEDSSLPPAAEAVTHPLGCSPRAAATAAVSAAAAAVDLSVGKELPGHAEAAVAAEEEKEKALHASKQREVFSGTRITMKATAVMGKESRSNNNSSNNSSSSRNSRSSSNSSSGSSNSSGSSSSSGNSHSKYQQGNSIRRLPLSAGIYSRRSAATGVVERITAVAARTSLLSSENIASAAAPAAAMPHPLMSECAAAMMKHSFLSSAFSPAAAEEEEEEKDVELPFAGATAQQSCPAAAEAAASSSVPTAVADAGDMSAAAAMPGKEAADVKGDKRSEERPLLGDGGRAAVTPSAIADVLVQDKCEEGVAWSAFQNTGEATAAHSTVEETGETTAKETPPKESRDCGESQWQDYKGTADEASSCCRQGSDVEKSNMSSSAAVALAANPPAAIVQRTPRSSASVPSSTSSESCSAAAAGSPRDSAAGGASAAGALPREKAAEGASAALAATRRRLQLLAAADSQQMMSSLMHPRDLESRCFLQQVQQNSAAAAAASGVSALRSSSNKPPSDAAAAEAEAAAGPAAAATRAKGERTAKDDVRKVSEGPSGGWPWRAAAPEGAAAARAAQQQQAIGAASRFLRAFQFSLPGLRGSAAATQEAQQQQQQTPLQERQQHEDARGVALRSRGEVDMSAAAAAASVQKDKGEEGRAVARGGGAGDAAAGGKSSGVTEFERLLEQQHQQRCQQPSQETVEEAAARTAAAAGANSAAAVAATDTANAAAAAGKEFVPALDQKICRRTAQEDIPAAMTPPSGDTKSHTHHPSSEAPQRLLLADVASMATGVRLTPDAGALSSPFPRPSSTSEASPEITDPAAGIRQAVASLAEDSAAATGSPAAAAGSPAAADSLAAASGTAAAAASSAAAAAASAAAAAGSSVGAVEGSGSFFCGSDVGIGGSSEAAAAISCASSAAAAAAVSGSKPRTSYNVFLDRLKHPSCAAVVAAVRRFVETFPSHLPREAAARLLHPFLTQTQTALLEAEVFAAAAAGHAAEQQQVMEGLERFVVQKLYGVLWRETEEDARENAYLRKKITCLQTWVQLHHLEVPRLENAAALLQLGKREIQRLDKVKCPRDKIILILNCCRVIIAVLDAARKATDPQAPPPAADDLLPLLIFVLLQARPPALHSHMQFIACFRHPSRLVSEEAYFFTHFCSAVEFIRAVGRPGVSLNVAADEYEAHMLRAEAEYLVTEQKEMNTPEKISPKAQTASTAVESAAALEGSAAADPAAGVADSAAAAARGRAAVGGRGDVEVKTASSPRGAVVGAAAAAGVKGGRSSNEENASTEEELRRLQQQGEREEVRHQKQIREESISHGQQETERNTQTDRKQFEQDLATTHSHRDDGVAAKEVEIAGEDAAAMDIHNERKKERNDTCARQQQRRSCIGDVRNGVERRSASAEAVAAAAGTAKADETAAAAVAGGVETESGSVGGKSNKGEERVPETAVTDAGGVELSSNGTVNREMTAPAAALAAAASALSTLEHLSAAAAPSPTAAGSSSTAGNATATAGEQEHAVNTAGEGKGRLLQQRSRIHLEQQYVMSPQEQQRRRRHQFQQQEQQQQQHAALVLLHEQLQAAPKTFRSMHGAGELRLAEIPLLLREYRHLCDLVQRAAAVIDQQIQHCDGSRDKNEKKDVWWKRHT